MPEQDEVKLSLTSYDTTAQRRELLLELFPDAFAEGVLDVERLKELIGQAEKVGAERYGLSWAGKAETLRAVQSLSTGTLRPMPEQSLEFDTTGNLIIEGDNLEVLKLLQKSYHQRVKMIYIDPPYNTGNEFIYPDNFREGLQTYLEYSGQVKNGVRQSTNTETNGRYHSRWLSMMFPRLFLARNLLRDDGFIAVSISDHEVSNLRLLLDQVFGEENFVAQLIWKSRQFPDSRAVTGVSTDHEYILIYSRSSNSVFRGIERDETKFSNPDNDERGPWMSRSLLGLATAEQRPNLHYSIIDPTTGTVYEPSANTGWRYSQERMQQLQDTGCILFPKVPGGRPREKKFRADLLNEFVAFPSIINDVFTAHGTAELREMFGATIFDFPKPSGLIQKLLSQIANEPQDIVLDFFAGSGTTAQAVMELNKEDGGDRKFILVQLPEPTSNSEYPTVAEITRERVRRATKQLNNIDASMLPLADAPQDRGFKAFALAESNFKVWNGDITDGDELATQLQLYADHRLPDRSQQDVLYELLLKSGRSLTAPLIERTIAGQSVYDVDNGQLLICLDNPIAEATLRGMIDAKPGRVLCLDESFEGNDQLKTNIVLQMRDAEIEFRTV
ncbi:MAG: site-specific DNA-methyltransferase [Ardenticatenales bacterium]|nr:site-specific DNA-methyltransferase [Ardenticatenales bacterium]